MALWRWRPRIKPGPPRQIRLNPQGRLSRGLWSAVLFENAANPGGMRDYAAPTRRLSYAGLGEQPVTTISPWGGSALSFATDTNAGFLGLESATQAVPTSISCSFLTKFDGTNGGGRTFELTPFYDPFVGANNFYISQSNDQFTDNDANFFLTPAVTTFSTWTRITITWDGTTASLYANGVFQSSAAFALGFAPTRICGNWPWPMADFFFWTNRVLSPGEATAHFADPYSTTLMPRRRIAFVGAQSLSVTPAKGALTIIGFAPNTGTDITVIPRAGGGGFSLEFDNEFSTGTIGAITFTGFAPFIGQAAAPGTGVLNITGRAPAGVGLTVAPAAVAIVIAGFAPTPTLGTAGRVTITGYAPTPTVSIPSPGTVTGVAEPAPAPVVTGSLTDFVFRMRAVLPHGWFPDVSPTLDLLLSGCAVAWSTCYDLLAYVRKQTRIASATGVFLDLMARDYFAGRLRRFVHEPDAKFSLRIRANLLPERGTRAGVIAAVTALVGEAPIIFEPADTGDTGAWGGGYAPVWRGMAYNTAGGWGSLALPFQAFVTSARARNSGIANVAGYGTPAGGYGVGAIEWYTPDMLSGVVPDDVIFQTISEAAPAGSIMWTRLGGAHVGAWDEFLWDSGAVWQ